MKPNISEYFSLSVKEVLASLCQCEVEIGRAKMRNLSQTIDEVTIFLEAAGKIRGQILYIMSKEFALELASTMVGLPITDMDELSLSALSEVGNIITGSTMTKLSELGYYCETTIPTIILEKDKALPIIDSIGVFIPCKTPIGTLNIGVSLREY